MKTLYRVLWWLIVAGLVFGMYLTCCDGIIELFELTRAAQYAWNLAFIVIYLPFFVYCLFLRLAKKEERPWER